MSGKVFKVAPLPFVGQKRFFLKYVREVLHKHIPGNGEGWTIVDVFGGSGLLAHTAKAEKPAARVIYNDYDGYADRLKHISDINALRRIVFDCVNLKCRPQKRIMDENIKAEIIDKINDFEGYKDLNCIASWLLFSGQQAKSLEDVFKRDFWHCVRASDYPEAADYLAGIEVVRESFHALMPRYSGQDKTLLLLDPPYLYTAQDSYKQDAYFGLIDFLRLIHITRPPFIFFSSTKSEFPNYINHLIEERTGNWESFLDAERLIVKTSNSYSGVYEDNMVFKF